METCSPAFRPLEMSPELLPPPIQVPDKSGIPFARWGAGPDTLGGWRKIPVSGGAWARSFATAATVITMPAQIRMIMQGFCHRQEQ
jgi:hypothetical protein